MSGEDDWVFDSLVGFLRGPVWNVPILTFIEQKSLIFEPEGSENEEEYKKISDEYKNLVDFILGSYMEDLGISSEQFQSACDSASSKIKGSQFHQMIFEQVWAADDYEIFKRMMIQKNIELQLQALELIQQKYGILPYSLRPGKSEDPEVSEPKGDDSEAQVMKEVSRKSLEEHQSNVDDMDEEEKGFELAVAKSLVEIQKLEAQKQSQQQLLAEHFKNTMAITDANFVVSKPSGILEETPTEEIDQDELAKRTEFLRSQRDKLLAMKKAEREKQLDEVEQKQMKTRPKSARAARSSFVDTKAPTLGGGSGQLDPATLQARRALAEKLKQEVIGGKSM